MKETLLHRLSQFYNRTQWTLILAILFPTVFTVVVGIVMVALYSDIKDIILGILTIVFSVGIIFGAVIVTILIGKSKQLALKQTLFLANVSHELRSPLTAIKMYAQTLEAGRSPEHAQLCVSQILKATEKLDRLIAQILEWKRITTKTDFLTLTPIDANLPAMDAIAHFRATHPETVRLETDFASNVPMLEVDRDAMERTLYNLLDNAAKYGGETGVIRLKTQVVSGGKRSGHFEYCVSDEGPGIEPEHLEHIFDVFYRARNSLSGATGVGLGLSIARSLVNAHGGTLFVESTVGKGSTFIVRLPLPYRQNEETKTEDKERTPA